MKGRASTKKYRVGDAVVARHRALARLQHLDRQISWITAPAGMGKSHLLRQVADRFSGLALMLPLEEGDADPGRFFQRLVRIVQKSVAARDVPVFGVDDLNYLRSFASRLFSHVEDHTSSRILFAFDDMHHLGQAPELLAALASAMGKVSGRVSFVIASREAPPGSWARLAADGRMARFGPDMLLMDAEEIRRLLSAHPDWHHGTDDDVVSSLLAVTQGWPSGVGVLVGLARTRTTQDRPFCGGEARDMVFESFSDQILSSLSPGERRQLMLVAPCPALHPEILRDVLGHDVCGLLERLCRNNVLVSKEYPDSDGTAPRYRLHALLRECLLHQGKTELAPQELRKVSARIARRLLALGDDDAGRELLVVAQGWTWLAEHLEQTADELFATGRIGSLTRFLEALPAPMRTQSPHLTFWRGVCLVHVDPSQSRLELGSAYARFKASGDQAHAIRAWGALVDSIWFEWEDCARLDPCIDDLPGLQVRAEELDDPALTAILAKGAVAALSIRRPEHPDFGDWEGRNLALFQRRLPRPETIRRGLQLMIHYVYGSGERSKAEIVRARLQQIYESDTESAADHCVYFVVNAAYQFWFSADGTQAPATVMTGLVMTERLGLPFWDVPMLNAALFRLASDENIDGLRNMLSMLNERLSANSREHDIAISHHFLAYLAWLADDHEKALIAIDAACRIAADSGFCISPVYYGIGKAAVLESLGRRREAMAVVRTVRRRAVAQRSRTMLFMAHMAGAAIALHANRKEAALAYLRPAFEVGERERFCAVPWLRLSDRERLCDWAVQEGIAPAFARTLKAASRAPEGTTDRPVICTLGRADVHRNSRSELASRKLQGMPLLLMLHLTAAGLSGRSSDQLIDAIWPDADTETGRRRLKTTLYRLRKLLGDQQAIASAGGVARIDAARVQVDAWQIERLIAEKGDRIETAECVLDIYQGSFVDLYSGHGDLMAYREYLAQEVEGLILRVGRALMEKMAWDRAAALFQKSLERFGFHEEFLECLRTCFERAGRRKALKRLEERWRSECEDLGVCNLAS